KIRTVIAEIKASGGNGDIPYFVADAKTGGHDFAQLLAPFADLHITTDGISEAELLETIFWNDVFPLLLTRALLPQLRATAQRGPFLAQFVGSQAALTSPVTMTTYAATKGFLAALSRGLDNDEQLWGTPTGVRFEYLSVGNVSTPGNPQDLRATAQRGPVLAQFVGSQAALASPVTMTTYAATKGFLATLSRGLDNDEQLWGTPTGVRFEYLSVGNVSTPGNPQDVSLMTPSAPAFAKATIGCGKRFYTPSLPHAILGSATAVLPERTTDAIAA
ncbi:hypothetical protein FOMPIDRAFT_1025549, partial [Fomitopsis schrenkii]